MAKLILSVKRYRIAGHTSEWTRDVRTPAGREFVVSITRGKAKPRGDNIGHEWWGSVVIRESGKLLQARVQKSTGVSGIMEACGVFASKDEARKAVDALTELIERTRAAATFFGNTHMLDRWSERRREIGKLNNL